MFAGLWLFVEFKPTVNLPTSVCVGSSPTAPKLHPRLIYEKLRKTRSFSFLRNFYALDRNKPKQNFPLNSILFEISTVLLRQVRRVSLSANFPSHQLIFAKIKLRRKVLFFLELRKNCVILKSQILNMYNSRVRGKRCQEISHLMLPLICHFR